MFFGTSKNGVSILLAKSLLAGNRKLEAYTTRNLEPKHLDAKPLPSQT
jgi:hypothetical protein